MDNMLIADEFGEKIGGSKRDLWRARGLCVSDLLKMNEAEKKKFVKKDSVWPKPDYQAMKDAGKDIRVIWFIKKVKDAVSTSPQLGNNESYVEEIGKLRDAVMNIETVEQACSFCNDYFIANGMCTRIGMYNLDTTDAFRNIGGSTLFNAAFNVNPRTLEAEVKRKKFLYTEYDKFCSTLQVERKGIHELVFEEEQFRLKGVWGWMAIKNGEEIDILDFNGKDSYSYFIVQGYKLLAYGIQEEELEEVKKSLFERFTASLPEKETATRKKRFIPKRLKNCRRLINGENCMRFMNTEPEELLNVFKFRGGEFGNWLNNDTRQESLNRAYEAFEDLAAALGISYEQVALNGRLAIAFGARGNGNAAAHYEPMREVINLTKFSGAGSLAHEYGHAIDDILSKEMENEHPFTEMTRNNLPSMVRLLDTMCYKKATKIIKASDNKSRMNRNIKELTMMLNQEFKAYSPESKQRVEKLLNTILDMLSAERIHEMNDDFVAITNCIMDALTSAKKELFPKSKKLTKDFEWRFPLYLHGIMSMKIEPEEKEVEVKEMTDFYKNSVEFDKMFSKEDKGYWASRVEMFARAFSCYITDKLNELGIVNDYLSGSSDSFVSMNGKGELICAMPVGEERKAINEAMDEFIAELKSLNLF